MLYRLTILAGLLVALSGCGAPASTAAPAPGSTGTMIPCNAATKIPEGTLLPGFTPDHPCQLEQSSYHAACLITDNTPSYPCTHDEQVHETALAEDDESVFIQREYKGYAGCWDATTWFQTSLKVCRKSSGAVTTLAGDVLGELRPSPDGAWLAFIAAEPGSYRMRPHLYRVRKDGSGLERLDTASYPYSVVGMTLKGWSADGAWIDVTLWDGSEGGYHPERIKAGRP